MEETKTALRAAFVDETVARTIRDRLAPAAAVVPVGDHAGLDAGRDLLRIERAGPFAVHPPWLTPPAGSIAIAIDPGHAFGTGSHPSTRLALRLVDRVARPGVTVADIGCGSGVLAIAAARLGARVVALDLAPEAVAATRANARRNGVSARVDARLGSIERLDESPDAALINVTVDVHEHIAPGLAPASRLVVAGVLGHQLSRVAAAHDAAVTASVTEGEWVAALLRRHPAGGGGRPVEP